MTLLRSAGFGSLFAYPATLEAIDDTGDGACRKGGRFGKLLGRCAAQLRDEAGAFAFCSGHAEPTRPGFMKGNHGRREVPMETMISVLVHCFYLSAKILTIEL